MHRLVDTVRLLGHHLASVFFLSQTVHAVERESRGITIFLSVMLE